MINSLKIQNFQSHKDTEFKFDKGVNVIIGLSDSGKSAIMRALRWLIWNRPTGEEFRSTWGGRTSVEIMAGSLIKRHRDKSTNAYLINNNVNLSAIKTDVPKEISDVLNINETNFQSQLDRPFLLDNTPGEVAAHFNRVAHLDQIDTGLSNILKWIREIQQNITSNENQVKKLEEELKQFEDLDVMEQDLEVLEDMEKNLLNKIQSQNELSILIDSIEEVLMLIKEQEKTLTLEPEVDRILNLIDKRDEKERTYNELNDLIELIKDIQFDYDEQIKRAKKYQEEFDREFSAYKECPLCGTIVKK